MNKVTRLRIAAIILFWFGIMAESITLLGLLHEYMLHHTLFHVPESWFSNSYIVMILIIQMFVHVTHITAGYLLSKGKKVGVAAGIAVAMLEIVPFITLDINKTLGDSASISLRILFAFVIFLILSGRKELIQLRSENWRPWKNPLTIN